MTVKKKKCTCLPRSPQRTQRVRKNHLSHLSALRDLGGKQIQNFLQDENAVSGVIGFVLIIGILIAASSIYFSSQVPEWTEDYESLHASVVADDFSELKTLIDGIVLKKGASELAGGAIPVKMAPDNVPILGMSPPGSNLVFNPENEKLELVVPAEGGGGVGGPWTWEQNTTSDFNAAKKLIHVDTYSDEVKLSKLTPEGNLILEDNDTKKLEGEHSYDQVIIKNNSTLYVSHVTGFLKILANNITVDSSSEITADRVGYPGGSADRIGFGPGYGTNGSNVGSNKGSGGGGAGYGAGGGDGGDNSGSGGSEYGNATSISIETGSGGGGGGTGQWVGGSGGNGGGAIWLDAEIINITGNISADGEDGLSGSHNNDGAGGGGSGGGILIRGKNVIISGTFSAKGGNGGNSQGGGSGGGGAGGRIKIFYESKNETGAIYEITGGTGGGSGSLRNGTITYISSITHHSSGSLISNVYDTGSNSTYYGEITWNATFNDQTIVMKVRTDMFKDMRASPDWDYCPAVSYGQDISDLSSVSDGHRYIQYCAELSTEDTTTTPVLHWVKINYSFTPQGQGTTIANSSGIIKFNSNYLYYHNQEFVYEHGVVIQYQKEGGFMLHPPPIYITNKSGIPTIEISMVDLTGANNSHSGATMISLKNTFKSYNLLADRLKYPNLTINLTTDYPHVWEKWFTDELKKTTLTTPHHYNVSVNATAKTVSVEFYGHGDGVELYLEKTMVAVGI